MPMTKSELRKIHGMFSKCGPAFIALGDEIRQKLIIDILEAGDGGINVMSLTAKFSLSRSAVSHHLKILKGAGFVKTVKRGTQVFYRISVSENFSEIGRLLSETLRIIEKVRQEKKS
ncbi:MAG: winged helix-turn-helix transcriptional regulator [Treponema sp.]|nr:winged helix-turn-helix transcriptional regulator [Treponema sp.]